ncbi:probable E3 ubiquitin-protein ligase BAH1-like 1 [Lactuca sativa]|uniref:probable E3 ubiquitin-protein ligase BAH1-like 1 n=1 Tax=Lactuca sativa TaxID=4236 RepID=UPI000CD98682|nr:probable E3 ubiquitin-protein ligase BAH1-like 1 [Lactuca sativa]
MKAPIRGRSLAVPIHVLTFSAAVAFDCPKGLVNFFPAFMKEMSVVVGCFNERAYKVLDVHLATGFHKYFMWCKGKLHGNHHSLIQEGKDLVAYAVINAIAMCKIIKKYDKIFICHLIIKIHDSKQGQAFRSQVQSMHMELLQSPWLCELIDFHINLRESKKVIRKASEILEDCSLIFNDGKPSLSCKLSNAVKLEINLTCSICLDIVFDPVYLSCGHIFCFMCACKSGSVTVVDGLKATTPTSKCPL